MTRPPWEVADIIHRAGDKFFERYCGSLTWTQLKVLRAIARCRTAALGGHRDQCVRCGHQAISYNSCRNRHCPKCQTNATGEVVVRPATGTVAGWLLSPGLQRAARAGPVDLAKQEVSVRTLVRHQCRNPTGSCGRSGSPRVPRSVSSAFCIRGDRLCSDIRTSTVSCQVVDCRLTTRGGSARHPASLYR